MDESLRTLELMASEVGATVLVLREIVLAGPLRASPSRSMSSSNPSPGDRWMAYRPDLGHRKKGVGKGRRAKRRDVFFNSGKGESSIEKRVIFDHADMEGTDSDDSPSPRRQSSHTTDEDVERPDEDVPPFHLDLEDVAKPESPSPVRKRKWVRKIKSPPRVSDAELAERERKAEKKQIRQEMRREERRLDLLRGDGTSSLGVPTPTPSHAPIPQSSLRLATPASSPDESFLDDLSHLPLDSLSLSFADVRNVSSSPSSSTDTEVALGEEMICVEALVVRKVQHKWGDLGEWGFGGGEDACGCGGGEEEVVGRGGDEVEVEVEGDKEDSWGLGSEEEGAG